MAPVPIGLICSDEVASLHVRYGHSADNRTDRRR
jgi:hypothetical protein